MGRSLNIAVCGAGIGGLSAAALLARQGHSVTLLDQFDAPAPVGSGLMLQVTGLTILDHLGLADDIRQLGSPLKRLWGLTTPSQRPVLDVRFEHLRAGLVSYGVQRGLLFDRLLAAATQAGAKLLTSRRVESVDARNAEAHVSLSTQAGLLNEDYYPGDVGFDPLGLKPTDPEAFAEMQTKELQNGRLAMLAAAGFLAQELVNHKPILETLKLLILLDDSEISKNLGINLPTGDIPTLELELETPAKDTFF